MAGELACSADVSGLGRLNAALRCLTADMARREAGAVALDARAV